MPTRTVIESERLVLREFSDVDSSFILKLLNTEGWLKYISNKHQVNTIEQATSYIQNTLEKAYLNNGFGLWRVSLKPHDTSIGMCGLVQRPFLADVDIGFAFLPAYHKCGYGLEAATATLNYARHVLHKQRIAAITVKENEPSVRLLEKMGFSFEKIISSPTDVDPLQLFIKNFEQF